jgi:hypothetical protein
MGRSRGSVGLAVAPEIERLRGENEELRAENKKLWAFVDWVATVSGKTFARKGDAATLADDEGHHRLLDRLEEEFGEETIIRNQDKKLTSRR